jgi:hypothetical protein
MDANGARREKMDANGASDPPEPSANLIVRSCLVRREHEYHAD